ncbi:hypothetical protein [Limisphaera sp. 4302-co]|uniref:hypothetical protein n=1 Tax=Limisphaera sp. 4302-co TaxID=3400417 RepID=UPI003C18DC55
MRFRWWMAAGLMLTAGWWAASATAVERPRSERGPLYAPHHPFGRAERKVVPDRSLVSPTGQAHESGERVESGAPAATGQAGARAAGNQKQGGRPAEAANAVSTGVASAPLLFEPPKSPLTPEQQARLRELLEEYKADRITAEEYHRERARVLKEGGR